MEALIPEISRTALFRELAVTEISRSPYRGRRVSGKRDGGQRNA